MAELEPSFVNQNMYPMYEVPMQKINNSIPGQLMIVEYVRAAGLGSAKMEAERRHPGYAARANTRLM
jgi:hypothetical protein